MPDSERDPTDSERDSTDDPLDEGEREARGDGGVDATVGEAVASGTAPDARSSADVEDGARSATTAEEAAPTATADGLPLGAIRRPLTFAGREYRVVFRSRWTVGIALVVALFAVGVVTISTGRVGPTRPAAVVITLAELSVYLVPLIALALGHGTVVDAAERGTLELLLALPVPRRDVVLGATLGRAFALVGALAVGFGAGAVVFVREAGIAAVGSYLTFVGSGLWLGATFLGLAVLVSTAAPEKSYALGGSLVIWAWFVLVHDLLALGVAVALDLSRGSLTALVLANPVDVFRLLVLASADAAYGSSAAALVVDATGPGVLTAALLAWLVGPPLAASRLIDRRNV
ncbi:MAG: ABC transporter permease [Haloglomus sp.]